MSSGDYEMHEQIRRDAEAPLIFSSREERTAGMMHSMAYRMAKTPLSEHDLVHAQRLLGEIDKIIRRQEE